MMMFDDRNAAVVSVRPPRRSRVVCCSAPLSLCPYVAKSLSHSSLVCLSVCLSVCLFLLTPLLFSLFPLSLSLTHTHTHSLSLPLSYTYTNTDTHTHPHPHTHTYTHRHARTRTQANCLSFPHNFCHPFLQVVVFSLGQNVFGLGAQVGQLDFARS
jgi:hypothetical protein